MEHTLRYHAKAFYYSFPHMHAASEEAVFLWWALEFSYCHKASPVPPPGKDSDGSGHRLAGQRPRAEEPQNCWGRGEVAVTLPPISSAGRSEPCISFNTVTDSHKTVQLHLRMPSPLSVTAENDSCTKVTVWNTGTDKQANRQSLVIKLYMRWQEVLKREGATQKLPA